jgi:hypothetical protein
MGTQVEDAYLMALDRLNVRRVADVTGRGLRTLHAYRSGERRITEAAAGELLLYLRAMSSDLTKAADALEAALLREADDG